MLFTHNVTKCRKNQRFPRQKRTKKLRVTVNKTKNCNVIENTFGLSCICDCFKPHSAESIMYESDEKAIWSATGNPLTGLYGSYCCNSVAAGMKTRGARGSPTDRGLPHFRVHWRLLVAAAGNQTETSTGGLTLEPETAEDYQPAKMQRKSTSIQVIKNSCGIDTESSRLKP